jgi:hypothetical protein
MAFTKLYLTNRTAPYTPATIRGAWDDTAGAVTKALDPCKTLDGGAIASVARAETNTNDEYDVLLYRGVSGPLAAQEIDVNVDVVIGVGENNAAANDHWHVHIYTTQGDSDTVRQTGVDNYRESAGTNEWPTTEAGLALNAAQSCHIHTSDGDRLVVEIGYAARNTSATSYTGTLWYGTVKNSIVAADLTAAGDETTLAGYISFSASVAEGTIVARASQGPVEVALDEDTAQAARASQGPVEVALDEDTAQAARVSQGAVEVVMTDDANPARVTQLVAELLAPTVVVSRVTQLVAELLAITAIESRTTQLVAEILNVQVNPSRVSQVVVELLGKSSTYCGIPSLSPAVLCGKPDVLAWLEWTVPMKES